MQNEKTRTFPEIWETLSADQRGELTRRLIVAGHCNAPQTVKIWGSGRTRPSTHAARVAVAAIIGEYLGLDLNELIFAR